MSSKPARATSQNSITISPELCYKDGYECLILILMTMRQKSWLLVTSSDQALFMSVRFPYLA